MNGSQRKTTSAAFFAHHPVFSLEEADRALSPPGGRAATRERLKYHLETGRIQLVAKGLYAVVPAGAEPGSVRPDPFLVAAAARPDAVFCLHSALELHGVAQSAWSDCTAYSERRRRPIQLAVGRVRFLQPPEAMASDDRIKGRHLGTRKVERAGRVLAVTGPERTLVECLRRQGEAGGLEEVVLSAGAFPSLDLELLERVLKGYGVANLWAATGWFLDRHRQTFGVSEEVLERWSRHLPASPQYLERGRRGGTLDPRWRLIVPDELERLGGPDER